MWTTCTARALRQHYQPAPDQILQRVIVVYGGQSRDRLAAARDEHLSTPLDALQMLAETVVQISDPSLITRRM
jgi:hypothetical protein